MAKRPERPKVIDVKQKATLDYVRDLAARGMYDKDIALCCGYNKTYFSELKKAHPELSEALNAGAAEGIAKVSGKLMDEIEDRNMTGIIFYLKAKANWRDNDRRDDGGADEGDGTINGRRVLESVRRVRGGRELPRRETATD